MKNFYKLLFVWMLLLGIHQNTEAKNLYSFAANGNWNVANTWTTDASGTTLVSPSVPATSDSVFVLFGKTVTLSANVTTNNLKVDLASGSILNLQTFQFTAVLQELNGSGRLRLASPNFPVTSFNPFVFVDGGTTEYNNTSNFNFSNQSIYNNLIINLSSSAIVVTQLDVLTLNGDLTITQGTFRINDNAATTKLDLTIAGSVTVAANGKINIGNGATNTSTSTTVTNGGIAPFLNYYEQFHRVVIGRSLVNNGEIKFTNMTAPDFNNFPPLTGLTAGAASVFFQGAQNDSLICNGRTDFYNLIMDKGINQTFSLTIKSNNYFNFRLFGANNMGGYNGGGNPNLQKALWLRNGNCILENRIIIPSLSEGTGGGSPNSDFYIPINAALVINHPDVILLTTADNATEVNLAYNVTGTDGTGTGGNSSFSVYGKFTVNAGYVSTRESGSLIYWAIPGNSAQFVINGGFVDGKQVRSASGGGGFASFIMTGGELLLRGRYTRTTPTTFAHLTQDRTNTASRVGNGTNGSLGTFNIDQNVNSLTMSGGNITILDLCGGSPSKAIEINALASNVNVTGGTFTIKTHTTSNADNNYFISADGRINNLIIQRVSGSTYVAQSNISGKGGVTARLTQPLRILNKMHLINNGEYRNINNLPLFIGGDLEINSGSVFDPGLSSTTFENFLGFERSASLINNGTITNGFNNLIINKSNDTLILAGSETLYVVNNDLRLQLGNLLDNGKTLNVVRNITNNATHAGSGKISLISSTLVQQITGDGNGQFGNLELNNTGGSSGSVQIEMLAHCKINGNLTLTSNRIFDVKRFRLTIAANTSFIGTFSSSSFIKTAGNQSDGGIVKLFNNTSAFVFPFGTGTNYTPASLQFSVAPTNYGSVTIRPVNIRNRFVTSLQALPYYWNITSSGFTGIPVGSVNHVYNYGNLADNILYVPGRYNAATTSFNFINDVTQVDEVNNTISFSAVDYLNGDYTAGDTSAFGIVTVYYSRLNGDYTNNTTWSTDKILKHIGAATASFPSQSNPVIIGDGTTIFHTVTIVADSAKAGSMQISSGSVLDVNTRKGSNFGVLTDFDVIGSGRLRISTTVATAEFPAGDFGQFLTESGGIVEYYSTGVDFTLPSISIAPTLLDLTTYRNLVLTPGTGRIIRMPDINLRIFENLTSQGITTGRSHFNITTARTLTIDSSLIVSSGSLRFMNNTIQTINVGKNIQVNSGASLLTDNTGTGVISEISVAKDVINNGTIDFDRGGNRVVNLIFQSNFNSTFSGAATLTRLGRLQINKGVNKNTVLELTVTGTLTTVINNWLTLTSGTFRISRGGGTYAVPTLNIRNDNTIFDIPSSSKIMLNNATAFVRAGSFNNNGSDIKLGGILEIVAGSFYLGDTTLNTNNDIEFSTVGLSEIDVKGGRLYVNGQIRANALAGNSILQYKQSGGTVIIAARNSATSGLPNFQVEGDGSVFNMSGANTSLVMKRGTNNSEDMIIRPESYLVTGGTIKFYEEGTGSIETIDLNTNISLNNIEVNAVNATNYGICRMVISPLNLIGNLLIRPFAVFNANSLDVIIGGNLINQNSSSIVGVNTGFGYNPGSLNQTTTINSTTNNQLITGVLGNVTNFGKLVVSNFPDTLRLSANTAITVNSTFSIISGVINDGGNIISAKGTIFNSSQHIGTGSIELNGSVLQTISGNGLGRFENLSINNGTSGGISSNSFQIDGVLNFISNAVLNINQFRLTLTKTSTAAVISTGNILGFSNSRFIQTFGLTGDLGVQKSYPVGANNFVFPLGVTGKYTPAQIDVLATTAIGSVTIKPVNAKHPLTTDLAAFKELAYYWITSKTGFAGLSANMSYTYLQADVNGTEANYDDGRFLLTDWTSPGAVNTTNNVISYSAVSFLEGEYTAGEPSEFSTLVFYYSRNENSGGNWSDTLTWSTDKIFQHSGAFATTIPTEVNGVVIANGHTVSITNDSTKAATLALLGNSRLEINNTSTGHSFSLLNGTGTLVLTSNIFPAGDFSEFVSAAGGTVEYLGSYTLPSQADYNNLKFVGAGVRSLSASNLTLNGNLTIEGTLSNSLFNSTITARKDWINNGVYNSGTGTVNFSSANPQSISGSSITTFHDINILGAGIKTLGISTNMKGSLSLDANTNLVSNGLLNITSDALNTGRVAELPSTAIITGQINVQRFIPQIITGPNAPRRNRMLSVPVNTGANFNLLDLQDDIFISGPDPLLNGFDPTPRNSHSIFTYNESAVGNYNLGFQGIATTSTNIPITTGLFVLIRGTRAQGAATYTPPFVDPDPVTMDYTGNINRGDISANVTYTVTSGGLSEDGYNFVGNPYPSQIDWLATGFTKTNLANAVYTYNPTINSYATFLNGIGTNGGTQYIASGQAFFVKAIAANPELVFRENTKVANAPANFFRNASISNLLKIKLVESTVSSDEMALSFDPLFSNNKNSAEDAEKLLNPVLNISSFSKDGAKMAINQMSSINNVDTIPLSISGKAATYSFEFDGITSFTDGSELTLKDNFLNQSYNLNQIQNLSFTITSDPLSKGDSRFAIIRKSGSVLPLNFLSFTGKKVNRTAQLVWTTANEKNNQKFIIERLSEGKTFIEIGEINVNAKLKLSGKYNFTDSNPFIGDNYYRLKQIDFDGNFQYSKIISLDFNELTIKNAKCYPVPASDMINVYLDSKNKGQISVRMISSMGVIVNETIQNLEEGDNTLSFPILELTKGIYSLELIIENQPTKQLRFLKL